MKQLLAIGILLVLALGILQVWTPTSVNAGQPPFLPPHGGKCKVYYDPPALDCPPCYRWWIGPCGRNSRCAKIAGCKVNEDGTTTLSADDAIRPLGLN